MRIKYVGQSQRRIVGAHEWNKANGFIVDIQDIPLAMELITTPDGEFAAVEEAEKDKLNEFIAEPQAPVKKTRTQKPRRKVSAIGG
jgi:hypothetical protein